MPKTQKYETHSLKTCAGELVLDSRKVAFIPESKTLLVADMHFEKGSYLREVGRSVLPSFDTHDTLERLSEIASDYGPKSIIALGDSFHDVAADERLSPDAATRLNQLVTPDRDLIWILGNHDPDIPKTLYGQREDHIQTGDFLLTHHPYAVEQGVNICGHYHPKAKIKAKLGSVSSPCFAISESCIILPSFGTYTGGLYVSDPAFKAAMPDMAAVAMTYQNRIFMIKSA
ncbi:ligase-associated DNA damage response endonuclease PdeM [Hellea balneolensis]|uniref:ligase-associated DNA damage response endonuclease PdeM n=1 Tax=Hellea balneolensis TaxID=287478 RepID=UPI00040B4CA6|nr:ligase-associated DNA damage response endonuclease PdeM [Hellea balneolensis]